MHVAERHMRARARAHTHTHTHTHMHLVKSLRAFGGVLRAAQRALVRPRSPPLRPGVRYSGVPPKRMRARAVWRASAAGTNTASCSSEADSPGAAHAQQARTFSHSHVDGRPG